ncbi:TetR/AcrR family transcriptional regulator [Paraburkholderia aspalathi]|uniref:TetR/AcrR family transcriptional regulator n=1 Tax=Paraburkholderia aspalathi TaxID=1324617 RepID=UPI001FC9BA98|nr:TetR/AcrR family transcriptional regulator [Paraburkholderia aspalathi]
MATHQRIVNVAARRFREVGLEGISVADVMTEAGLTVGGFYKHFESRDDLVVEALAAALADTDTWQIAHRSNLRKAILSYLSEAHRDALSESCALAALVNDVSRSSEAARDTYTIRLRRAFEFFEKLLPTDLAESRRPKAMLLFSACVGALGLSRSVSDPKFSKQILANVADELIGLYATQRARR